MFQSFCSRFFWGFWFANDYSLLGDRWMSFLNWRFGTSFISWVLLGAVEAVILIAPQKENGPPRFHANSKSGRWGSRPGFHVSFQRDKIHSDFYCNESWRLHDISWIWQQKLCERSNFQQQTRGFQSFNVKDSGRIAWRPNSWVIPLRLNMWGSWWQLVLQSIWGITKVISYRSYSFQSDVLGRVWHLEIARTRGLEA